MTEDELLARLPDDVKVVNCAECGRLLLGTTLVVYKEVPWVASWILGRPYCYACSATRNVPPPLAGPAGDESPWQANAIRDLEGD